MNLKNEYTITDFSINPESLPFNYKKWIINKHKNETNYSDCESRDYMTTKYEIIKFYKPIFILKLPE